MTTTPTLLALCRQFDAAYVPGFNERFAAALENKTELSPEDAACFEARMKIGDEIEKRLGVHREEFEKMSDAWMQHRLDSAAESSLLELAQSASEKLDRALPHLAKDARRFARYLSGRITASPDLPLAIAQSHVIFATDDKVRPLIDKLRVLLS